AAEKYWADNNTPIDDKRIIGPWYLRWTWNARQIREVAKIVKEARNIEAGIRSLSDDALKVRIAEIGQKIAASKAHIEAPQNRKYLAEVMALLSESYIRTTGIKPFDVQLAAAIFQTTGRLVELCTGEGKTIVTALAAAAQAMDGRNFEEGRTGKGDIHIIVANDYLARQAVLDKYTAGSISDFYAFLGLSVGVLQADASFVAAKDGLKKSERRASYKSDIIIGTASQFGFDYLRDRIALGLEGEVQGERRVAIVDEVDQILIDEAVTPLILSGGAIAENPEWYRIPDALVRNFLEEGKGKDYTIDAGRRSVNIEERGLHRLELLVRRLASQGASLDDPVGAKLLANLSNAIKAYKFYEKDKQYTVTGEGDKRAIVLIDQTTNRPTDRKLGDGMHQALEVKEGIAPSAQMKTEASVSIQNYFRGYRVLAGGTGTGITEAAEFEKVYKREIVRMAPNRESKRDDRGMVITRDNAAKARAIIASVVEAHNAGRSVLVGTGSIEESEAIGDALKELGYNFRILNAKSKADEELIVSTAGEAGAITIATDMAGRGTNIRLSDKARNAGGLHVIVTQGDNLRRVGQLRGRAARQGDPGSSIDIISLEDEIIANFDGKESVRRALGDKDFLSEKAAGRKVANIVNRNRAKLRAREFEQRDNLVKFDDAASVFVNDLDRAKLVTRTMSFEDLDNSVEKFTHLALEARLNAIKDGEGIPDFVFFLNFNLSLEMDPDTARQVYARGGIKNLKTFVTNQIKSKLTKALDMVSGMYDMERHTLIRMLYLNAIVAARRDYMDKMEDLKDTIGLRGIADKKPIQEYQLEAPKVADEIRATMALGIIGSILRLDNTSVFPGTVDALAGKMEAEEDAQEHRFLDSFAGLENTLQDGKLKNEITAAAEKAEREALAGRSLLRKFYEAEWRGIPVGKISIAATACMLQVGAPAIISKIQDTLQQTQHEKLAAKALEEWQDQFELSGRLEADYKEALSAFEETVATDEEAALKHLDRAIAILTRMDKIAPGMETKIAELNAKREDIEKSLAAAAASAKAAEAEK
ncbi:MAG: hypothetical protein WC482_05700, partial [Candidatus Omnitrophota bacterium]